MKLLNETDPQNKPNLFASHWILVPFVLIQHSHVWRCIFFLCKRNAPFHTRPCFQPFLQHFAANNLQQHNKFNLPMHLRYIRWRFPWGTVNSLLNEIEDGCSMAGLLKGWRCFNTKYGTKEITESYDGDNKPVNEYFYQPSLSYLDFFLSKPVENKAKQFLLHSYWSPNMGKNNRRRHIWTPESLPFKRGFIDSIIKLYWQ